MERTLNQALSENGYVNAIDCRKCRPPLGFVNEDIEWAEGRKLNGTEWEFNGYITCPFCGEQTVVQVDRADMLRRWMAGKFYTIYSSNQFLRKGIE